VIFFIYKILQLFYKIKNQLNLFFIGFCDVEACILIGFFFVILKNVHLVHKKKKENQLREYVL
jgi:hypothetical protein